MPGLSAPAGGKATPGAPHVLITRTPDGRLTFLQAIAKRSLIEART
jgi:hypothetical protein